jgi:hypothetical protein
MKTSGSLAISVLLAVMLSGPAGGGETVFDYALPGDGYAVSTFEGAEVLSCSEGVTGFEEGLPDLPTVTWCFVIPQGTTVTGAGVEILSETTLAGFHDILPVRMTVIGAPPAAFTRNPQVYFSDGTFPADPVVSVFTGTRTGFRLGSVTFTPFRYNPLSGRLSVITSARVAMEWESDPAVHCLDLTDQQVDHAQALLQNIVRNPADLASCRPATGGSNTLWSSWVAIGAASLQSTIQPLVDHRNSTGTTAEYVTTEWIYANYTGYDTQEKIRNYIKDAYENHGLMYALVIGDWGETQRISSLNVGGGTILNETSDLYYSDLDGSWDLDGDHLYGENTDGINYYSDVSMGRFSSNTISQIQSMVQRTIEYETISPTGVWRTSTLLAGAGLWPEYGYWGSFVCDSIANRTPAGWTDHKLYETSGGHPTNQIDIINQGVSYASPQGHGNYNGIFWYYAPDNMITNANYSGMTNWGMFPVFHSIACLAGRLSATGCIAERLMMWPEGGAIAVMFNSNNGYGAPPSMGPSEHLEVHFANQMFVYGVQRIGDMQAAAKDAFKAAGGMSLQNWVLQENNMLGDPATLFLPYQTGIEDGGGLESGPVALGPASPNPAAGSFQIAWSLPASTGFSIDLFDVSGRLVRSVQQGPQGLAGVASVDCVDSSGAPLAPGCYLVRISSTAGSAVGRVVVI